jgi:hypothetical protein
MYDSAQKAADEIGPMKGSIRKGRGTIYGMLGEEIFQKLCPEAKRVSLIRDENDQLKFDYDFELGGLRIDVKSKMTGYVPKPEYEGSVTKMPKQQDCDIYFFCRIHKDTRYGWVCGWQFASKYMRDAYLKKKGDKDSTNGNVCKRTCWNMFYKDMYPLGTFEKVMEVLCN